MTALLTSKEEASVDGPRIKYACTGPDADEPVDTGLSYALFSVTLQSESSRAVVTTHQIIEAMKKTKLFKTNARQRQKPRRLWKTPYTLAYGPSGSWKVLNTFWKPKYQEFGRDSRNFERRGEYEEGSPGKRRRRFQRKNAALLHFAEVISPGLNFKLQKHKLCI